ncbi:MAG TPA: hypothetical protein VFF24_16280 [Acidimicrobiia bacterium]|nr:hypothetical protein [Acidimicrobiia bacterium]
MELLKWCRLQWDRLAAVIAFAAGAVLLIAGWLGVSGVVYPAEQIPYVVSAGFGGLFLLGVGGTLWHSADLRDQWRTLDRIEQHLARGVGTAVTPDSLDDVVARLDALEQRNAGNGHSMTMLERPTLPSEARR